MDFRKTVEKLELAEITMKTEETEISMKTELRS